MNKVMQLVWVLEKKQFSWMGIEAKIIDENRYEKHIWNILLITLLLITIWVMFG